MRDFAFQAARDPFRAVGVLGLMQASEGAWLKPSALSSVYCSRAMTLLRPFLVLLPPCGTGAAAAAAQGNADTATREGSSAGFFHSPRINCFLLWEVSTDYLRNCNAFSSFCLVFGGPEWICMLEARGRFLQK